MTLRNVPLMVVLAGVFAVTAACNADNASTASTDGTTSADAATTTATTAATMPQQMVNSYGGEAYLGEPALDVTAALIKAGGGADNFSFANALVAMLGQETVNAEVAKLTEQYGKAKVDSFIGGMDFAVNDALKRATEAGIALPAPADLSGADLAKALVKAGVTSDGTFWSGHLFDMALSHKIHNQVMQDIDTQVGADHDLLTHTVLNQAMYDVAQALGMKDVKLAALH